VELVARITESFRVTGRGTVQAFEFVSETAGLRVGDRIQLKIAQAETYDAVIRGIEHLRRNLRRINPAPGANYAILLAPPLDDHLFEKGTEIWVFPPAEA
jgi:hypothetical protein